MLRFLSFDVGTRSLSVVLFTVPKPIGKREMKKISPQEYKTTQNYVSQLKIEHWECIDLLTDNNHTFREVKGKSKSLKKLKDNDGNAKPKKTRVKQAFVSLDTKTKYLLHSLKQRSYLYQYGAIDYVLIENQPYNENVGSIDNKVLSYIIRTFYQSIFNTIRTQADEYTAAATAVANAITRPKQWCYDQFQKSGYDNTEPKIVFVSPKNKLRVDFLSAFCGGVFLKDTLDTAKDKAKKSKISRTKETMAQAYRGRKDMSIVYTTQILQLMPNVAMANLSAQLKSTKISPLIALAPFATDQQLETIQLKMQSQLLVQAAENKKTNQVKTSSTKETKKETFENKVNKKQAEKVDIINSCRTIGCLVCPRQPLVRKNYQALYLDHRPNQRKYNETSLGRKFHHNIVNGVSKDRRSDLGDCFLQALVYYMRFVVKYKKQTKTKSKMIIEKEIDIDDIKSDDEDDVSEDDDAQDIQTAAASDDDIEDVQRENDDDDDEAKSKIGKDKKDAKLKLKPKVKKVESEPDDDYS